MKNVKLIALVLVTVCLLVVPLAWAQGGNPPASTKESGATSGHGMTAAEQTGKGTKAEEEKLISLEKLDWEVTKKGSARESERPRDFGGFGSVVKSGCRSRRCGGNVETRVLCGFPSSEGGAGTLPSESHHFAIGASFP